MNFKITLGCITFLIWMGISNWWYIGKIKHLYPKTTLANTSVAKEPVNAEEAYQVVGLKADSVIALGNVPLKPELFSSRSIYFPLGSSFVKDSTGLKAVVQDIKEYIEKNPLTMVQVIGYTCDIGSDSYNNYLGLKRASKIKKALVDAGIPSQNIEVLSKGKNLLTQTDKSERRQNRRVEITTQIAQNFNQQ